MLLHFRYRRAVIFPTLFGVFLLTCNTHRDVISILSRVELSIAYNTILASLHLLAADADTTLRGFGKRVESSQPEFLILYDNVNKMQRAWQKSLGHQDELKSGTAATLIRLQGVPPGALGSEPLLENIKKKGRAGLTVKKLEKDIEWDHIHGVGVATVMRTWIKHIPALSKFRSSVEGLFTTKYSVHPLPCQKSEIHTMRSTDIDESSTVGSKGVLYNLVISQLGIMSFWLARCLLFVCGELSIDRVRKIKLYMAKANPGFERHEWALPLLQLWHLKWNWQKAIIRQHWWPDVGKQTFGLKHDVGLMGREKFNHEKCDFYQAHHILEDRFDAMVLHALRYAKSRTRFNSKLTNLLHQQIAMRGTD